MTHKKNYNIYNHKTILISYYAIKLTKFKALKWRKLNEFLIKALKKKFKHTFKRNKRTKIRIKNNRLIVNPFILKNKFNRIKKKFSTRWEKNLTKKKLFLYYYHNILKKKKKTASKLLNLNLFLLKPLFNLSILLWKNNFCSSFRCARQILASKNGTINTNSFLKNQKLSKGFLVTINNYFKKKDNRNQFVANSNVLLYFEIDYYTNSFIIIKDYKNLTLNDYFLCVSAVFNVSNLLKDN